MSRTEQNENRTDRIPQNDPSKAMDSKKEVEESNDEKIDQDFPGYPHYPTKEDIMDQRTDSHRVDLDVENLPNGSNVTGVSQRFMAGQNRDRAEQAAQTPVSLDDSESMDLPGGSEDVNDDDLLVLNATNGEIGVPQNVSNDDLADEGSLPGTDLDEEADDAS